MAQHWKTLGGGRENLPRVVGERGRARLVVLGAEVGGRWSGETAEFLAALSKAKAESAPENVRDEVRRAWLRRWRSLLGCTAARALATSLLERRTSPGGPVQCWRNMRFSVRAGFSEVWNSLRH